MSGLKPNLQCWSHLSEDQLADESMSWWKNKLDLIYYEGINLGMVKASLAFKKRKENEKCISHVQLRNTMM